MKPLLSAIIIFLLIGAACHRQPIDCIRPYTTKEQTFIDSIEATGLEVKINRFNYSYTGDSLKQCGMHLTTDYTVYVYGESFEKIKNLDTMRVKTRLIATQAYTYLMENHLISYMSEVEVIVTSGSPKKFDTIGSPFYSSIFKKSDLEAYCGFYIKDNGSHFSREKVTDQTDTLAIFEEHLIM